MQKQIRVLVVDDSAVMRNLFSRALNSQRDIVVVGVAADGQEAVEKVRLLKPDVVTMDVEMPVLDGVAAVARLMKEHPVPVVMLSAHTTEGAEITMEALAAGAVDFVTKPRSPREMEGVTSELVRKIKVAARLARVRKGAVVPPASPAEANARPAPAPAPARPAPAPLPGRQVHGVSAAAVKAAPAPVPATRPRPAGRVDVVVVGSSTGGPSALQVVLPALPSDFPAGVVVVQHLPVGFSAPLAELLARRCRMEVKHAEAGDRVRPGLVLVAPAGYDLTFHQHSGEVVLSQGDRPRAPGGFRPSVDVVMTSAASVFRDRVLGVLLTGMGRDGAEGMAAIKRAGGRTIAQDESTCVVFGMPRAAIQMGVVDVVAPLPRIAEEILRMA